MGGLAAKLVDMRRLAAAGVAFCVHAVVLYGNRFDDAAARAVRQHRQAITERWCCSSGAGAGNGDAAVRDDGADDSGKGVWDASAGDRGGTNSVVRKQEPSPLGADQRYNPIRRGDIARQRAGDDPDWGTASLRWPIRANICARRVTALYNERAYGDAVPRRIVESLRRQARATADRGGGDSGGSDGPKGDDGSGDNANDGSDENAKPEVPRADRLVTELRQADGSVRTESAMYVMSKTADWQLSHSAILARGQPLAGTTAALQLALSLVAAVRHMIAIRGVVELSGGSGYQGRLYYATLSAVPLLPLFSAGRPCPRSAAATAATALAPGRPRGTDGDTDRPVPVSPLALVTHTRTCASCAAPTDDTHSGCYCAHAHLLVAPGASSSSSLSNSVTGSGDRADAVADVYLCHECERAAESRRAPEWGPAESRRAPPSSRLVASSSSPSPRNLELLPPAYRGWCASVAPRDRMVLASVHSCDASRPAPDAVGMILDPRSPDHGLCRVGT